MSLNVNQMVAIIKATKKVEALERARKRVGKPTLVMSELTLPRSSGATYARMRGDLRSSSVNPRHW